MLPPPPLWSDCDTRTGSAAAAARSCVRRVEARAPWHSGGTALASVCMQAPSGPLRPSATVARGEDRSNIYHCQRQRVESIADRPVAHNAAGLVNFVERFWVGFSMGDLFLLSITCTCRLHGSVRRGSWSQVVRRVWTSYLFSDPPRAARRFFSIAKCSTGIETQIFHFVFWGPG